MLEIAIYLHPSTAEKREIISGNKGKWMFVSSQYALPLQVSSDDITRSPSSPSATHDASITSVCCDGVIIRNKLFVSSQYALPLQVSSDDITRSPSSPSAMYDASIPSVCCDGVTTATSIWNTCPGSQDLFRLVQALVDYYTC